MARPKWYDRFTQPNFIAGIGILVARSYIDFSHPGNMEILRYLALTVALFMVSILGYLYFSSKFGPNAQEKIFVKNSQLYPDEFGLEPSTPEEKFQVTVAVYDTTRLWGLVKKVVITCTIGFALHLYLDAPIPLLMLCITQPSGIYKHQLFKIHILRKDPKLIRSLRRPWPNPPLSIPFGKNGFFAENIRKYREMSEEYDKLLAEQDSVGPTKQAAVASKTPKTKASKKKKK